MILKTYFSNIYNNIFSDVLQVTENKKDNKPKIPILSPAYNWNSRDIYNDGSVLSQDQKIISMKDRIANYQATQSDNTLRATMDYVNAINGFPVLKFKGSVYNLANDLVQNVGHDFTIFSVRKVLGSTEYGGGGATIYAINDFPSRYSVFYFNPARRDYIDHGSVYGGNRLTSNEYSATSYHISCSRANGSELKHFKNGVDNGISNAASVISLSGKVALISGGASDVGEDVFIGEIIYYNRALSDSEVYQVFADRNSDWGGIY